jgi:hypothetical protein
MGLLIVYLAGLLLGVAFYALTIYFSKEIDNKKRNIIVAGIGVLVVIGGLMIGGFNGMPISVIGVGILTVAILLMIVGNRLLGRKVIFAIAVLVPLIFFTYNSLDTFSGNYVGVAAKDEKLYPDIKKYYEQLQVNTNVKGFKTFNSYEGEKAIVLSLGEEKKGNNIEVLGIEKRGERSIVNIRTFDNKSSEKNPTIIIVTEKIEPNIEIKDTDGTVYKEVR